MTHGQDPIERAADKGDHFEGSQVACCREAEEPAKKVRCGKERDGKSRRGRDLKHQRDRDVRKGESRRLGSFSGCGGASTAASLAC